MDIDEREIEFWNLYALSPQNWTLYLFQVNYNFSFILIYIYIMFHIIFPLKIDI